MATKIYGFNNGGPHGFMEAVAIAETGVVAAMHICTSAAFMPHDLGMDGRCTWKHDQYNQKFPEGWETEWVPDDMRDHHLGLRDALKKNSELPNARGVDVHEAVLDELSEDSKEAD